MENTKIRCKYELEINGLTIYFTRMEISENNKVITLFNKDCLIANTCRKNIKHVKTKNYGTFKIITFTLAATDY